MTNQPDRRTGTAVVRLTVKVRAWGHASGTATATVVRVI